MGSSDCVEMSPVDSAGAGVGVLWVSVYSAVTH